MPDTSLPPLAILFRDEWIVAIDKPAGQLVHPAEEPAEGDLVTMKILRDQIGERVHLIHRLDRPTSGVMVFAIDSEVARKLHQAFEAQDVQKIYWAVIDGHPTSDDWRCAEPIRKSETAPERSAETEFRVIDRLPQSLALVEARPRTGRFHQIRRHLLHAGHPIVGDYRYMGNARCDELGSLLGTGSRMLLQAKSLQFQHPTTGSPLHIEAPTDPLIVRIRNQC
ncbi:MAG: RluA family pseudouridine synthase [Verrucomicrobiae bacterium]|nr:RluA family pseudouridine synthase [Verrucomicrobiae bacterium]